MAVTNFKNVSKPNHLKLSIITNGNSNNIRVTHYGESNDGDYYHDSSKPTKQNIMCGGQPAWAIIKESNDFRNNANLPRKNETAPTTKFTVLRPEKSRFAVVIDVSGSMKDHSRLARVQQSATDWINYDVQNGSSVALVKFS